MLNVRLYDDLVEKFYSQFEESKNKLLEFFCKL